METENSAIICALVKFTGGKSTRGAFTSDNVGQKQPTPRPQRLEAQKWLHNTTQYL